MRRCSSNLLVNVEFIDDRMFVVEKNLKDLDQTRLLLSIVTRLSNDLHIWSIEPHFGKFHPENIVTIVDEINLVGDLLQVVPFCLVENHVFDGYTIDIGIPTVVRSNA